MKSQILAKLRRAPVLSKLDLILTLLPALGWIAAVEARSTVISPRCINHPETCTQQSVLRWDRWNLGFGYDRAEEVSLATQYVAGILALAAPLGMALAVRRKNPLPAFGTDLVVMVETISWNGLMNECARLLMERPRPFVYLHPIQGTDPANYTSFYSGHTSFVTAISFAAIFTLMGRNAPPRLTQLLVGFCAALVLVTGLARVLAGKHFPTDVLFAIPMAAMVAFLVASAHRERHTWP